MRWKKYSKRPYNSGHLLINTTTLVSDNGTKHCKPHTNHNAQLYTLGHQSAALDHNRRGRLRIKLAPRKSIPLKWNMQPEVMAIQPASVANIVIKRLPEYGL